MQKVIIIGTLGMAGHIMAQVLDKENNYEIFGIARQKGKYVDAIIDVSNFQKLEAYIQDTNPHYVINCVGALVSQSKNDISSAILLNSYLPHFLSDLGNILNYKLIHISTDCVFSGKDGNYQENSYRDGDDNYARSKALGEVVNDKDLTIRTSIIGPEIKLNGTGLLDWFFKQEDTVNGYSQAYWSGVTTLELAQATVQFLKQDITGLYQLCPIDKISKFNLLKLCNTIWDRNMEILAFNDYKIDKSLICTRKDFIYPDIEYHSMLMKQKEWMDTYPHAYLHYKTSKTS